MATSTRVGIMDLSGSRSFEASIAEEHYGKLLIALRSE